jgi:hypothetical protein
LVGGLLRSGRCMTHSLMSSICKHVATDRETGDRTITIRAAGLQE